MRIVGRSESPSFPSLETLLPMEKSWALEVEKEEETRFLQAGSEHHYRGTESVKQTETSWVSCKRLNSGSREASHRSRERENELYSKRASRSFDSKLYRNDQRHDSSRPSEETERAWQFKSSSRCYPPSVNIRSSEFSVSPEERASGLQTQRGLHESRKFARPDRTNNSVVSRQHFMGSKNGYSKESQGVGPSVNTLKRRQDYFACPDHRRETASVYEASGIPKGHMDDKSGGHQEPDKCKLEFQPFFDKHRQYRHGQYHLKSEFSEHGGRHASTKKIKNQGTCHGLTDQKNAKQCGRSDELKKKKQHINASLAGHCFEGKPHITNGDNTISDAASLTEDVLPEGISMFESSHTEGSEVKHDSLVVKEQYEMLACLLFDDLQDLDEDSDVALVDEGPGYEYGGVVFDNESKVSMDTDDVREVTEDAWKPSAVCTTKKQSDCHFSGKLSMVKSPATKHSNKFQDEHACLGLKKSPQVLVDVTNKFEIHTSAGLKGEVQEDDAHRLSQRQRQVDFGKNTLGYERYTELVPRTKRKAKDPQTPNPKQVCSKRSWDGQIRKWRRLLHIYDPPSEDGEEIAEDFSILKLQQSHHQNGPDAKQETSSALGIVEADESKGCTGVGERKNVGDASLTIYEDWMES